MRHPAAFWAWVWRGKEVVKMASFCYFLLMGALSASANGGEVAGNPAELAPPLWRCVTEKAAFSPRDTAEDLIFADKMWLSNGYYHGNVLTRDLWSSVDGITWVEHSASTPYDGYSELVVYKDKMWAIKGSVWSSPDGLDWKQVAERTPFGARGYGEVIVFQDKIWQLGSGQDVWNTVDGIHWTCVTENAAYGNRTASAVAVFDGKLWLMGGKTPGANTPPEKGYATVTTHNDVWSSSDGETWTQVVEHAPWSPRQWFVAKVYRDKLWIVGGHDNVNSANLGDVWHTADGKEWHPFVSATTFSARHEPTAYVFQDSLWVIAGNAWPVQNDVWRLSLPQRHQDPQSRFRSP
jgi:hypothetical protein